MKVTGILLSLILLLSFTIKAQDVKIGKQTWATKNLDVSKFRNGEAIPLAKTNAEWELAGQNGQPAWCYYENKAENGTTYGKLYNWYAVNDPRGLAPNGYHIPTFKDWTTLTDYLGGESPAGIKMKSISGWQNHFEATNSSGFEALPGGFRHIDKWGFDEIGTYGNWWGSSEASTSAALSINLGEIGNSLYINEKSKRLGFSVRCLRDDISGNKINNKTNIVLNEQNNDERILDPEEKKEQARQKSIEEAWEAADIYGFENRLHVKGEFNSDGNEINYYIINGIKYYNDGFKVIGKKRVRYDKNDEIFRNPPDIKISWSKKYPCVENYAIEKVGEYDAKTNFWTIENVIYKPTGKKSLDNGKSWVDFYCSDDELKDYIEQKK